MTRKLFRILTRFAELSLVRRAGLLAGGFLVLIFIGILVGNWMAARDWKRYKAAEEARGEHFDIDSVVPPPVPDELNFAKAELFAPLFNYELKRKNATYEEPVWGDPEGKKALEEISVTGGEKIPSKNSWIDGRFVNLEAWRDFYRSQPKFNTKMSEGSAAEEVLEALQVFEKPYSELRAAAARPKARFPVRYEDGVSLKRPHFQVLMDLALIVRIRAAAELALDKRDAAFDDVGVGLKLVESMEEDPALVSLLVELHLCDIVLQPIWEGLVRHQWSERQLASLNSRLGAANFAAHLQKAMRGERNVFVLPALEMIRQNPGSVVSIGNWGPEYENLVLRWAPSAWYDKDKIFICGLIDQWIESADPVHRRFDRGKLIAVEDEMTRVDQGELNSYSLARLLLVSDSEAAETAARAQSTLNLACVALALERHRLKHGAYPDSLSLLDQEVGGIDAFSDPLSGNPPHYIRHGDDQFTLYFNGWNEVDDGGAANWADSKKIRSDWRKGDWVWPQVTKPENADQRK